LRVIGGGVGGERESDEQDRAEERKQVLFHDR
jgi:hypothetical protein